MPHFAFCLALTACFWPGRASGGNGTWTNTTSGGVWSDASNWSGGVIADGADATADFSTLDIPADNTVHLDGPRTVGTLLFGDAIPSNNWILDNNGNPSNSLTLAVSSGTPLIQVNNQTATINATLTGSQGLMVARSGTLAARRQQYVYRPDDNLIGFSALCQLACRVE